jgi:hypothetical protein
VAERGVVRRLGGSHLRTIRPLGRTIAHPFAPGMNKPIPVMQAASPPSISQRDGTAAGYGRPSHRPGDITLYAGYPKQ